MVTGIEAITPFELDTGTANALTLNYRQDGDSAATLQAEAIVLSTGWLGNVAALNLTAAGVQTDGRYVWTDDTLRTSAPHIYAAGDITGRIMLVQTATAAGRLAAENAVLRADRRRTASRRSCRTAASPSPSMAASARPKRRRASRGMSSSPPCPTPTSTAR